MDSSEAHSPLGFTTGNPRSLSCSFKRVLGLSCSCTLHRHRTSPARRCLKHSQGLRLSAWGKNESVLTLTAYLLEEILCRFLFSSRTTWLLFSLDVRHTCSCLGREHLPMDQRATRGKDSDFFPAEVHSLTLDYVGKVERVQPMVSSRIGP